MQSIAAKHFSSPVTPMRFQQNLRTYQAPVKTLQFAAKREYTASEKELLAYKHQTILNVRQLSITEAQEQLKESRQRLDEYLKTGPKWPLQSDGEQALAKERILHEQLQRRVQPKANQNNFTIPQILRWLGIGVALGTALVVTVRQLMQPST